jgi:Holliday junction resolvasome RuvABC endonuclease subunit
MIYAGIDYSLTSPSICIYNSSLGDFKFDRCMIYFLSDVKKLQTLFLGNVRGESFEDYNHECQRYDTISDWAIQYLIGCTMVGLEDYAFAAKGRVFHIAENTGILKYKLFQQSIPVETIPPTVVKKNATGKGNADKQKMYECFVQETGVMLKDIITPNKKDVGNPVSDIVDSYYICKSLWQTVSAMN